MYVKFEKCIIDTLKYKVSYRLSTYLMVKRIFTQNIGHLSLNKSCKLKFILENDFQNIPGRQANKKTYRVDSNLHKKCWLYGFNKTKKITFLFSHT